MAVGDDLDDTRYKLDEIAQAFDDLHHGRVTRGVVIMDGALT